MPYGPRELARGYLGTASGTAGECGIVIPHTTVLHSLSDSSLSGLMWDYNPTLHCFAQFASAHCLLKWLLEVSLPSLNTKVSSLQSHFSSLEHRVCTPDRMPYGLEELARGD